MDGLHERVGKGGWVRPRIFIAVSLKFEMMVDVDTVLRGCSACLTVIISDWLSFVARSSPEDYLSVSASIHPSAAVDISTVLSTPLGYRFELPSALHIYIYTQDVSGGKVYFRRL